MGLDKWWRGGKWTSARLHARLVVPIIGSIALFISIEPHSHLSVAASVTSSPAADSGRALFARVWTTREGLGPLANALSCVACHSSPAVGGGGHSPESMVLLSDEESDPTGGHLFRQLLIRPGRAVIKRPLPREVFRRRPPSLRGLGLLEQVPESVLEAAADPDDRDADRISGRLSGGRFGWKARFPSLEDAVAAALVNELGLTNPRFHDQTGATTAEMSTQQLRALTEFVRGLAPPGHKRSLRASVGARIFDEIGCARCHTPQLRSDAQTIEPYTDLLLHDMGAALADGFPEGEASPREFRTAPLWGIGTSGPGFLHDGRAPTLDAAIRLHDGEAQEVRRRYERLPLESRRALLSFLRSLSKIQ